MFRIAIAIIGITILTLSSSVAQNRNGLIGNWTFEYKYDIKRKEKICGTYQLNTPNELIDFNIVISKDTLFAGINCESTGGIYTLKNNFLILSQDSIWSGDFNCIEDITCFNSMEIKHDFNLPIKYKLENDSSLLMYFKKDEYFKFTKF
ncbi:MAG: hypothetical protein ABI772_15770 [Bacteroidota bacterium]